MGTFALWPRNLKTGDGYFESPASKLFGTQMSAFDIQRKVVNAKEEKSDASDAASAVTADYSAGSS